MSNKRIVSGIQPTGAMHIGNYFGAIKQWLHMQDSGLDCYFFVANLHAITIFENTKILKSRTLETLAMLIACGIDPKKSKLFVQSTIPEHLELYWILNCLFPVGWLSRMTQFKDKGQNSESASAGLYTYPVLQCADILLYDASLVPVGDDQKQHIEITRDIAIKFNSFFKEEVFAIPEPYIIKDLARIKSLTDGSKKMSKSGSELSVLSLKDDKDLIAKKIKKAPTDSLAFPECPEDLKGRHNMENLINIYRLLGGYSTMADAILSLKGSNNAKFKSSLTDLCINFCEPINSRYQELMADQKFLLELLENDHLELIASLARNKLIKIKKLTGLL